MEKREETKRFIYERYIIDSLHQTTLNLVGNSHTLAKIGGWTVAYPHTLLICAFSWF